MARPRHLPRAAFPCISPLCRSSAETHLLSAHPTKQAGREIPSLTATPEPEPKELPALSDDFMSEAEPSACDSVIKDLV